MLFNLKNPLNRKLSPEDLHRCRETSENTADIKASYLGASLINRKAHLLPAISPKEPLHYHISGHDWTLAPVAALILARHAVEQHHSVLTVDFFAAELDEALWQRFWALSFYLDRAKDFRLIDFNEEAHSDYLGETVPKGFENHVPFLAENDKATHITQHLEQTKGIVTVVGPKQSKNPKQVASEQALLWQLTLDWLETPELLIIFNWQTLSHDQQNHILEKRQALYSKAGHYPALITVSQEPFNATSNKLVRTELMFRQRNSISDGLYESLKKSPAQGAMSKVFSKLAKDLEPLQANQALLRSHEGNKSPLDLIQISDTEGLPWPPPYRPLRSRHPGT